MKKILTVLLMILGIGVSAFAGTYKNYENACKNIWWEVSNIYHVDMGAYRAAQWEITDDTWGGFGRQQENIMKNFIQVSPNFNGVVTQPTLVNGTDKTMWCFHYKNGKHYKTTVWTFYIPEAKTE